jgi:Sap, sulfolipid-1-addressing protein
MPSLLVQILPVAVVIALEPICVIAALVMLGTDRPLANGWAYLAALVGVMLGYGLTVLLVFHHHALTGGRRTDDIVQLLWLLLGVGFLVAFAVFAVRRPRSDEAEDPRWLRWVQRMGPLGAAGIGVFLVNWEMETPALTDILKARVPLATAVVALVLFVAVAVSTSAAPVAAYLAAPGRVGGLLAAGKAWLVRYQRPIVLVLFGLIGALYTTKGLLALLGG